MFSPSRNGNEDYEMMYQHYVQQEEHYCYILLCSRTWHVMKMFWGLLAVIVVCGPVV
jgi:hypothetical protein